MKTMNCMMTLALAMTLGCGGPTSKDNNDPNPDPDPDTHNYQEITFEVTNNSLSSVFLDQRTEALTIYHGNDVYSLGSVCNEPGTRSDALEAAGAPFPGNSADAAPSEPSRELRPGEQWIRQWNGIVRGEGSCPNLTHLLGEELVVEFCYGMNVEGSDQWSASPTDIECARQSFTHTDDRTTIEISIDAEVLPGDTLPIIVENKSAETIYLQLSDNCGGETFYSVMHSGTEIGRDDLCGPCDCSEGSECTMACDLACAAPMVEAIEPSGTHEAAFALTYRKQYDEGTHQCTQLQYVPVGPLMATICYGLGANFEGDGEWGTIEGEICETLNFTTTDDEVRLIVQ